MAEIFVVTGSFQHDEESGHWNVGGFTNRDQAEAMISVLLDRAREYLPKWFAFYHSIPVGTSSEERYRLIDKATERLRQRIGDKGFPLYVNLEEIEYSVETLNVI